MGLGVIRFDGRYARPLLIAATVACLAFAWLASKWHFANGVSSRVDVKELADLMIGLAPADPQTHFAAAVLYEKTFEQADAVRSLAEFETATALTPNNYLLWLELGKARGRNGDTTGSEKAFLRALELAPNYSDVHWAYGNSLLRAGRIDDGFSRIRQAAAGRSVFVDPAVVTAMTMLDGDVEQVRRALDDSPAVNAALSTFLLSGRNYDEAVAAWDRLPANEKRTTYKQTGESLISQLIGTRQFRKASRVAAGVWDDEATAPKTGSTSNGGFETAIKQNDDRLFSWQFGIGSNPQMGLSDAQKHGGAYSLYLNFNTVQAADLRKVAQTVSVEPGSQYSFEVWYRADVKGSVAWEIVDACDGKQVALSPAINPSADWMRVAVDFKVPASCDGVTLRLVRDGCMSAYCPISGNVWFDDISIHKK